MTAGGQRVWRSTRPVANLRQGRTDWYRIENKSATRTAVYIYDEIGYFGVTAADFVKELNQLQTLAIDLHVNTPGGDVFEARAIYNALKTHPATIDVVVDSLAASAGSWIVQAGDTRTMAQGSEMMIHDAYTIGIGNAEDLREQADLLDRQSDAVAAIYAEKAGGTVESWRGRMKTETWFSAEETVAAGLADKVAGAGEGSNTWDLSIFNHPGRASAPTPEISTPPEPVVVGEDVLAALKGAFA